MGNTRKLLNGYLHLPCIAIHYYKEGIRHDDFFCWGGLAKHYSNLKDYHIADICFYNTIKHQHEINEISVEKLGVFYFEFIEYMNKDGRKNYYNMMRNLSNDMENRGKGPADGEDIRQNLERFYNQLTADRPDWKNW